MEDYATALAKGASVKNAGVDVVRDSRVTASHG
jgi:hypothetical protein